MSFKVALRTVDPKRNIILQDDSVEGCGCTWRTSVPWAMGVFSRNGDPFMVTTQYSFSTMENLTIHEETTCCKPLMSFSMKNVAKEIVHCTQNTFISATIE